MDLIRSWSQIVFSRDAVVGGLLLAATLLEPWVGLYGVLAALIARGVAGLLGLAPLAVAEGLFGYNAVLFGLGVGALLPHSAWSEALLFAGTALTVVFTAALGTDFGVGATENVPSDVEIDVWPGADVAYTWFQANESFTCSADTRVCN